MPSVSFDTSFLKDLSEGNSDANYLLKKIKTDKITISVLTVYELAKNTEGSFKDVNDEIVNLLDQIGIEIINLDEEMMFSAAEFFKSSEKIKEIGPIDYLIFFTNFFKGIDNFLTCDSDFLKIGRGKSFFKDNIRKISNFRWGEKIINIYCIDKRVFRRFRI